MEEKEGALRTSGHDSYSDERVADSLKTTKFKVLRRCGTVNADASKMALKLDSAPRVLSRVTKFQQGIGRRL